MLVLGIDTSTSYLSIAVRDGDRLIAESGYYSPRGCSAGLLPLIEGVLKYISLPLKKIDGLAVSLGPGSFTGLRIGVSTMKGLSFALSRPIVGIPTMDVLAENLVLSSRYLCPVIDAKRGQVYSAIYKSEGRRIKKLSAPMILSPAELLKEIKTKISNSKRDQVIFLGDGLIQYQNLIKTKARGLAVFAPPDAWFPRASVLTGLALKRFLRNDTDNSDDIVPLYLRRSEAEDKYDARMGRGKSKSYSR